MKLRIVDWAKTCLYILTALLACGCALEKKTAFNRTVQNVTAHYNILYNARDILAQKQIGIAFNYIDSYNDFLSVYPEPTLKTEIQDKDLDLVITKANTIISLKEQSHYLGDAYLLLGKANYLKGNYYNAVEFFNYVDRSFPKQKNLTQEALIWKVRSLIKIDQLDTAKATLDTAFMRLFAKQNNKADLYATKLQYDLEAEKFLDAEQMAIQAVNYSQDINHRLRWTFILAQVQELNQKSTEAYQNYTRVVNSNASFEMAFNASLNRIRIEDSQNGRTLSRAERLRNLLNDGKNKDFADQIYFQLGELSLAQNNISDAVKDFILSVRKSTKNVTQKGLSYLRLADINFKNKADYVTAKKYYDSTLLSLSPTYPGYVLIQKKSDNLQLLADRLQIISREDTLQILAKLPENERTAKATEMAKRQNLQQQAQAANLNAINSSKNQQNNIGNISQGNTFYLYNTTALSQGFNDFKRVWGNRPLSDNWRRSVKGNADLTNSTASAPIIQSLNSTAQPDQSQKTPSDIAYVKIQQQILQNIPLTQVQLAQSNAMILNAYLDIANFYRDVLDDRKEAIANYEIILKRFPDTQDKASTYYNLYRLYNSINPALSDQYKNRVLKEYPESNFAKVILDPEFSQKMNDQNAEFTAFYNDLYTLYATKKYPDVIDKANALIKQFPTNPFIAQVYYLKAIAAGHQEKLPPFRNDLEQIVSQFPGDRLIGPLVKEHLVYIKANEATIAARPFALVDNDPNEVPYVPQVVNNVPVQANKPVAVTPMTKPAVNPAKQPVAPPANNAVKAPVVNEPPSIFSLSDSTNYYFVVNVNSGTVNLAPSRFGIGQFNRANFQGNNIRHQLKPVENSQLIYVGRFNSLDAVKDYARGIAPLLPQIMKVPPGQYTVFVVTQSNLDKITDKKTLDSYFEYYQRKY